MSMNLEGVNCVMHLVPCTPRSSQRYPYVSFHTWIVINWSFGYLGKGLSAGWACRKFRKGISWAHPLNISRSGVHVLFIKNIDNLLIHQLSVYFIIKQLTLNSLE
jgi:hypothetical protein